MLEVEGQQLTANCTCNKIFKDFLTLEIQNFSSESKLTASFTSPSFLDQFPQIILQFFLHIFLSLKTSFLYLLHALIQFL